MHTYKVTNLHNYVVTLPPPISWQLRPFDILTFHLPPMTDAEFSRKYAALIALQRNRVISVVKVEEPGIVLTPGAGAPLNTFTASCSPNDLVGDLVRISDIGQVAKASINSWQGMPAVGCILTKSNDTTCVVQLSGTVSGYTGLTPGKMHFIGETGRPVYPRPVPEPGTWVFIQPIGVALNSTTLVLNPGLTLVKVFT